MFPELTLPAQTDPFLLMKSWKDLLEHTLDIIKPDLPARNQALSRLQELTSSITGDRGLLLKEEGRNLLGLQKTSHTKKNDAPLPQIKSPKKVSRIEEIERWILTLLLLDPGLASRAYENLCALSFEDEHSEFLWRCMESRIGRGELWQAKNIQDLDLPPSTLEIFVGMLFKKEEFLRLVEADTYLTELFITREIEVIKKDKEQIKSELTHAGPDIEESLLSKDLELTRKLKELKSRLTGKA
jgi:hypothetical protein